MNVEECIKFSSRDQICQMNNSVLILMQTALSVAILVISVLQRSLSLLQTHRIVGNSMKNLI